MHITLCAFSCWAEWVTDWGEDTSYHPQPRLPAEPPGTPTSCHPLTSFQAKSYSSYFLKETGQTMRLSLHQIPKTRHQDDSMEDVYMRPYGISPIEASRVSPNT